MSTYDGKNIRVLKGLEAVRLRPGMYIGGTGEKGLHHLIWEIIDNSIDEHMNGYGNTITLTITKNNSIIIEDNGRGIPVDLHPTEKIPTLTVALTILHAGGKFDSDNYKVSGGLHGVGVSVVNALSVKLIATVYRDKQIYQEIYSKGEIVEPLKVIGTTKRTGTTIEFYPDSSIFQDVVWKDNLISDRLKELAYLNPKLTITYNNQQLDKSETYHYEGGVEEYVSSLTNEWLSNSIKIEALTNNVKLDIALRYSNKYARNIKSFVNNVNTIDGGMHVVGFTRGVLQAIQDYISRYITDNKIKDMSLTQDDVLEGMGAIVSIYMSNPEFEGQTKGKLGSPHIRPIVYNIVKDKLYTYLEHYPDDAKEIINKIVNSYLAREAARKARDLTRSQQAFITNTSLPTKLADCSSKNSLERELFIVEGDSAGGSAKQGRDREFQAILPIRGKILNVEKVNLERILASEEIKNIVTSLGCGIGENFNLDKLRYHKVIIMTDSDVDGSHIQTLLLTFFYRYIPELIHNHKVYIAQPPLYRLEYANRQHQYYQTEEELNSFMIKEGSNKIYSKYTDDLYTFNHFINQLLDISNSINSLVYEYGNKELITELVFGDYIAKDVTLDMLLDRLKTAIETKRVNLNLLNYTILDGILTLYVQSSQGLEKLTIDNDFLNNEHLLNAISINQNIKLVSITNLNPTIYPLYILDECIEAFGKYTLQRYKGLGEMNPDQLWETTMAPDSRTLLCVHIEDDLKASDTFKLLMGEDPEPRKRFISEYAKTVKMLDI